ncbi:hypothetical protein AVEN_73579-1 [Araneus ventricosus]|uniref:Uncharacterized protein n=1 Tax=Araneus ventricosus TaxID=182803 RepID=A0A4Y2UXQ1_ARAVE|nr:hypothetical protein AVEN_73579-1 [Araneus ventricosus]
MPLSRQSGYFFCSSVSSSLLIWPRCAITANRLFLCSSVSSALLCYRRCPITANRLFLCSSVSSALLSCPRCAMSDNRLFRCSSVSSALLSCPRCVIVAIGGFSFNNSPFTFTNCLPSTGSIPCNSSFSFRHRKKRELNKAKIVTSKYQLKIEASTNI